MFASNLVGGRMIAPPRRTRSSLLALALGALLVFPQALPAQATQAVHEQVVSVAKASNRPTPPKALKVTSPNSYAGRITWKKKPGATQYQLSLAGTRVTTTRTSMTAVLFAGEKVSIRAKTKSGWSTWSKSVVKKLTSAERRDLRDELGDLKVALAEYNAEVKQLRAELSNLRYWLSIAVAYGDNQRAEALRAEISEVEADILRYERYVTKTNARISTIQKQLDKW